MNFDLCTVMFVTADVIVICKVHSSVFVMSHAYICLTFFPETHSMVLHFDFNDSLLIYIVSPSNYSYRSYNLLIIRPKFGN